MSLSEFMSYIQNKPLKTAADQISRGLHEWEIALLDFMNNTESTLRRFFTRRAVSDAKKSEIIKQRLEISPTLGTLVTYLDINDLKLLISIVKNFSNKPYSHTEEENKNTSDELKNIRNDVVKFMKSKFKDIES